ncbi:hypothetical protein OHT20_01090 [Streptomyces caniferus]|uniref:Amidase n=1 Tax=Streptomyces caniferus TaxID=285557 RepID=A0A640S7X6_9ACTN|nr:hypothetical protein [Streptomyces caniferus]GFE05715.1 hypothetical protein Scani_19830 [Streptomyces caniferus]
MTSVELTAPEVARWALHAGLPLPDERHTDVAATANYIHTVIRTLRELDFGETPPAAAYSIEGTAADATL